MNCNFMRIKQKYHHLREKLYWWRYLRFPLGKKVYLIGTPNHSNIGDSAIACAELLFLKKIVGDNRVKELTVYEYQQNASFIEKYINKKRLICGHGGGNMGNLWYVEELFRYSFIDNFPNNPIIIFPQTVFFTNDEDGEKAKIESLSHYNIHNNLTIVAREKQSFEMMNCLYKRSKVLLTPDIVLSTKMEDYGVSIRQRSGALLVFRDDSEKQMFDADRQEIQTYLAEKMIPYRITDMYSSVPVTKDNRMMLVKSKMQEFADSQIVITDRLHGMVFAALTGTPCIVFPNNHHKVKGTFDWISYLPYIEYVSNVEDAKKKVPQLLNMLNNHYSFDNTTLMNQFMHLRNYILDY